MGKIITLILFIAAGFSAAAQENNCSAQEHPLPALSDSLKKVFEANLAAAFAKYRNDSLNAEHLIWYGRRLAYLGHYRQAIDIYTKGLKQFPQNARFLRHRGHRYITLRCFDDAITDLKKATELVNGQVDEVEADGLPNALNIPTSTLFSNIWYHLGLAYYFKGDYKNAMAVYEQCLNYCDNNDMYVATLNWLYITLRKLGKKTEAEQRLKNINPDMKIIENGDYLDLLLMYKNNDDKKLIEKTQSQETLSNSTLGFGLGNYYLLNGRKKKAREMFEKVVAGKQWSSFAFIAAEAELR
jgi:tetratricopeptide (TPR) repeat protein